MSLSTISQAPFKHDVIPEVKPKKEQLGISIHFSSGKSMELDVFFYRYFIYRIFKCFFCDNLKKTWKKGLIESYCYKVKCDFKEMWEI